ncbi:MAG: hypothetical protein LUM44_22940 [Pyrinomonadaceae bacterium]|nr:hypothetical protein [Pyrinomonadaceae bacterium]
MIEKVSALCVKCLLGSIFAFLLSLSVPAQGDSDGKIKNFEKQAALAEFVTDGCTWFPDGNYFDCCVQHDREYYAGGSRKARWHSDKKLFLCIASKPKFYNKFVAPIAWLGVRVGGVAWLNASFSWGFSRNKSYLEKVNKKKNIPAKSTK